MEIFPAIDLYEGQAVRLLKGDYEKKTVYGDDPVAVAEGFKSAGARNIHLVDLEGARGGGTPNFELISRIVRETGLFAEVGGGIRSEGAVEKYLAAGVQRVILGTAAVSDRTLLASLLKRYGERVAVGVDVRGGYVAVKGWRELSGETLDGFCAELQDMGVRTIICTDISKDGAMQGTNRALYRELAAKLDMDIIASGGVSALEDVVALRDMGLYGAILGRAIYTGGIDLAGAIEVCR